MTGLVLGVTDDKKIPTFTPWSLGRALQKTKPEEFQEVKALRLIQIGGITGERGQRLSRIQEMSNLRILDLEGSTSFGANDLAQLLKNKHLEELHLHALPEVENPQDWESILKEDWTNLESLSITGSPKSPGNFPKEALLAILTKGTHIKKLDLSYQKTITEPVLLAIAKACPNLEEITLCGCPEVQIHALLQLPNHCTKLSRVNVARIESPIDLRDFKKSFPYITADNENSSFYDDIRGYKPVQST